MINTTVAEKQPLVSVIIPTYKRPDRLSRAVESVLNQTYPRIEVIVVDDNDPDTDGRVKTEAIMEHFKNDPRVRYIQHEHNKNGSAARNTGARTAIGEYLAFLDDDDEYLPRRVETMIERIESLPEEYAVCYSRLVFRFSNGKEVMSTEKREGDLLLNALMKELNINIGSNNLVKRSAYDSIGGFDESFQRNQDHEFLVRLLQKFKIAYCDELGLIVNVPDERRNVNIEKTLNHYVETFKPVIDTLSPFEKKQFYNSVNRNLFSFYVRTEHNYKKAWNLLFHGKITLIDAVKVLWNGAIRVLKRKFSKAPKIMSGQQ